MTEKHDYMEMKVPAKAEFIKVIRLTVSGVANRMGFSYDDIEDLKVVVSEACTNVVQHAYKDDEEPGDITIGFKLYENRLEIIVVDHGHINNLDEIRKGIGRYEEGQEVQLMREGGLGLYLIETLMDEVIIHQDQGMTILMTKFVEGR